MSQALVLSGLLFWKMPNIRGIRAPWKEGRMPRLQIIISWFVLELQIFTICFFVCNDLDISQNRLMPQLKWSSMSLGQNEGRKQDYGQLLSIKRRWSQLFSTSTRLLSNWVASNSSICLLSRQGLWRLWRTENINTCYTQARRYQIDMVVFNEVIQSRERKEEKDGENKGKPPL